LRRGISVLIGTFRAKKPFKYPREFEQANLAKKVQTSRATFDMLQSLMN